MSNYKSTRRRFLRNASMASFGLTTASSSLFKLNALRAAMQDYDVTATDDYKALVCLFKPGGNDSFNMLLPYGQAEYNEYATTRSNLAIDREDILPLDFTSTQGKTFGVHPEMEGVQQLFNNGDLCFISNVGTMIHPVSKVEFDDRLVPLPLGLFSHSDQIAQWETAYPHQRIYNGWGGKLAEMFSSMNDNQDISMNITLSGNNVFQFGRNIIQYSVGSSGSELGIDGYKSEKYLNDERTELINSILDHPYEDMYKKTYVDVIKSSLDSQEKFQESISEVNEFNTDFSDSSLSRSFRMIARIIAARQTLGFKRQIFFVRYGGWDHHDGLIQRQNQQLPVVSNALNQFAQVLKEIGAFDSVVTFSMSEFGRTLTSNGNGSDHAWGGNVMAMGGPVLGKKVYGEYPSLAIGNPLDLGRGRLIPTISTDEYFGEIAMWFGANSSELPTIFPNIGNFYSVASANHPIGFLAI